jgi:hypothetical protein
VQRSLVWVAFASAAEICLENHCNIGKVQSLETHLALSKTIQNHDADFLHWLSGIKIEY